MRLVFFSYFITSILLNTQPAFAESSDALLMPNAPMNEQVLSIPGDPDRPVMLQVTVFTPNGPGPFPLAILNHGASGDTPPASQPRNRTTYAADYFLSRGYAVALPMMRGYAGSGGKVEVNWCDFLSMGLRNARDVRAVVSYMEKQPNIDANRVVMAGQSFGGWNTLAFGALQYPNVKGLINFSGGLVASNCATDLKLSQAVSYFGEHSRVPSLWFYGDNDKLFPVETWRKMLERYTKNGGNAELVAYGKFMENSHLMLSFPESFPIWVPKLDAFLAKIGLPNQLVYPEYMPTAFPPPSHFAAIDDVNAIPYVNDKGRELYQRFLAKPLPRVFALASNGSASMQNGGFDPIKITINQCQQHAPSCRVYAVDNEVVWVRPTSAPPTTHFATLMDQTALPYVNEQGREGYVKWLALKKPRAFVIAPNGAWSGTSRGDDPLAQALSACNKMTSGCQLYAVDDAIVWPELVK
ncbi:Alpha/beta hydrolase family [Solimicrobium silvestre]|uniref:Alpha/beta hydrolase family n=2 Tax=Solimicrobium silvestre TaxID=2099400 RepID=A0A2S9H4H9_9BURK|nr:Alpha/beta hydrolase family [Solimicrobium silvestre]